MKLYQPITLKTEAYIRQEVMKILHRDWDFETEVTVRVPMKGELIDTVNAEMISLGYGPIAAWTAFSRGPGNTQKIHVDALNAGVRIHSAVLVPITGCDNSVMQWFDETHCVFKHIPTADLKSTLFRDISQVHHRVIEEVVVSTPMLANVSVPHRAVSSDVPRSLLSIKFENNPVLL